MDKKIVLALYNFTLNNENFSNIIRFIIKFSAYIFFALFVLEDFLLLFFGDERLFKFFCIVVIGILLNMIFRKLINRKRPFDALGIKSIVSHKSSGSFPSNHSASAMIIAVAFMYINVIFGLCIMAMAFITGISRVFAGIHYLSDVLFGFLFGFLFSYIGFFLM